MLERIAVFVEEYISKTPCNSCLASALLSVSLSDLTGLWNVLPTLNLTIASLLTTVLEQRNLAAMPLYMYIPSNDMYIEITGENQNQTQTNKQNKHTNLKNNKKNNNKQTNTP